LKDTRPDDLGALAIAEAVKRAGIDPALIEDVYMGCANQAGEDNRNVARMSLLLAGLPVEVAGATVNRLCGSGLQAVLNAAQAIKAGDGEVFVAGGLESMTRAPFVMGKADSAFSRAAKIEDTTIGWRFVNPRLSEMYYPYSMGETAENVAEKWRISRQAQDEFAYTSQMRCAEAQQAGRFKDEIIPVMVAGPKKGTTTLFDTDEHPRADTTLEKLAALKPAFKKDGTVTAGNASGVNDGSAALVVTSYGKARELGLKPMARVICGAVAGVDPAYMGVGPVPASRKALQRAGISVADLDLVELNEAFASQSLACVQDLGLDREKVNVNGGAIALGHPLGASGARILTTLLYELRRRGGHYGLATMCIGVGQGIAAVVEMLD
jgi:3-oxoadipyl-CoA thiolase